MSVLVRPVRPGDAAGKARLWRESGEFFAGIDPDTAQEPDPQGLEEWIVELDGRAMADPAVLSLVAEDGGEVVGQLVARLLEPAPSARWQLMSDLGRRRVHVDALAVAGSHRRSGVGTALMTAAEKWAADQGAEVITLETGVTNPTSMPFYEQRMGYAPHEVQFRKVLR